MKSTAVFLTTLSLLLYYATPAKAQIEDIQFGFHLSPAFSWMQTNDPDIKGRGSNMALSLGLMGEYPWQDNVSLIGGINVNLNQGGRLVFKEGGNFFPRSSFNNPKLNTGEKPLPDGVEVKYSFSAIEIPFGLKMKTQPMRDLTYFAELPVFSIGMVTSAKADIAGSGISADDEDIGADFRNLYLSWRVGIGAEYQTASNAILVGGIHFQRGISDMTRDKGVTVDNSGESSREKSRASYGNLIVRLGLMF